MNLTGVTLDTHTDFLSGAELARIGRLIESLGFESVWLPDAMGREPFVAATFLLANTTRLKVGTGIVNIYGRDAMTAAQARRTLGELYPGRFLMGMGVSNPQINAMRNAAWSPPAVKMSGYLKDLKGMALSSAAPASLPPIYFAAHGPQLQALAAEADGIMTWTMPAAHIALSRQRIGPDKEITAQLPCVLTIDPAQGRAIGRQYLSLWLGLPHYRQAWADAGFGEADFADGGSDRLIDGIVAWGDAAAVAERVRAYHGAGATRVIIEPIRSGGPREAPKETNAITAALKGGASIEGDWEALTPIAGSMGV